MRRGRAGCRKSGNPLAGAGPISSVMGANAARRSYPTSPEK